jgi:hypothetical protein
MAGGGVAPIVFVNNKFPAILRNSTYVEIDVPQGHVAVAATPPLFSGPLAPTPSQTLPKSVAVLAPHLPPVLQWPKCGEDLKKPNCTWDHPADPSETKRGCAAIDWSRLEDARPEDRVLCYRELSSTAIALDNWLYPSAKLDAMLVGLALPGSLGAGVMANAINMPGGDYSSWLQMCGLSPFPVRSSQEVSSVSEHMRHGEDSDDWNRCKNGVSAASLLLQVRQRLAVEADAGKTYYFKWSRGKMEMMDEATGTKQMHGLHPVKDR